jgi:hypothetical protein
MSSDTELQINIKTTADLSGAKATEDSLKGLGQAASDAGKQGASGASEIKGLGREVKELSHLGHDAERVMDGLARGGLGGLAQAGTGAARIIKALALSFGPLGWAALAVGTLVGAFFALKDSATEANKTLEDTKKDTEGAARALSEAKKSSDEAEKSLKNLAENGAKDAAEAGKLLEESFVKAERAITRAAEAAAKVRKAENELQLAKIDAAEQGGKLTPEAADAARFAAKKVQAHGDLAAEQKLAKDLVANEEAKVKEAQYNVTKATYSATVLSEDQQSMQGRKGVLATDLTKIQDEARIAADSSDEKIAAAKKARADFRGTGRPTLDRPRIESLDAAVVAAEDAKIKIQQGYSAKVVPLAKERTKLDAELEQNAQGLAKANAALEVFSEILKRVSVAAKEKESEIKQDLGTKEKVAKLDEARSDLKKPGEITKPAAQKDEVAAPEQKALTVADAHNEVMSDMAAAFSTSSKETVSNIKQTTKHMSDIADATSAMSRGAEASSRKVKSALKNASDITGP